MPDEELFEEGYDSDIQRGPFYETDISDETCVAMDEDESVSELVIPPVVATVLEMSREPAQCDLDGVTDPNSKPCNNAREICGRVLKVNSLLIIANVAHNYPEASCDVISLIQEILPICLEYCKGCHGVNPRLISIL